MAGGSFKGLRNRVIFWFLLVRRHGGLGRQVLNGLGVAALYRPGGLERVSLTQYVEKGVFEPAAAQLQAAQRPTLLAHRLGHLFTQILVAVRVDLEGTDAVAGSRARDL